MPPGIGPAACFRSARWQIARCYLSYAVGALARAPPAVCFYLVSYNPLAFGPDLAAVISFYVLSSGERDLNPTDGVSSSVTLNNIQL